MRPDQALSSHPLARTFPHLKGTEFDELVADIKTHGLREPITRFEGKILDGWNRYRACLRLKLEPRFEEFEGDTAAALAFVISKNIVRRHLKPKDKRDAIAALLKADPNKSDRQVAAMTKTSPTFVGKVRAEKEAAGDVSTVDTRTDSKGRKQSARKKKTDKVAKAAATVPAEPSIEQQAATAVATAGKSPSRKERRQIMRVEIERFAARLVELDRDSARTLFDILWTDDRNAGPLVWALGRLLGVEETSQ